MAVAFKIQVTKHIIANCKFCRVLEDAEMVGSNCPIAVSIKHIFPKVHVSNHFIFPFGINGETKIDMPSIAQNFVNLFDSLCAIPKTRLLIPEFEFDIEIPDEVLEGINIEELVGNSAVT